MKKKEPRKKRVSGRLQDSLYGKFSKFCEDKRWSESVGIEEAIIRMVLK